MLNLLIAATVSYQITSGLPLKHDGYVVERTGSGEEVEFVVKAATKRAFSSPSTRSLSMPPSNSTSTPEAPTLATICLRLAAALTLGK